MLEGSVGVFPVVGGIGHNPHVQQEGALKQLPHVVRGVDLFHFHFSDNVAMVQEIDVGVLDLEIMRKN